jgi:hypothetical protein
LLFLKRNCWLALSLAAIHSFLDVTSGLVRAGLSGGLYCENVEAARMDVGIGGIRVAAVGM